MSKAHKCRVPGPCWGCRHTIERGDTYATTVVWAENGPCRTVRLHPECLDAILKFNLDDWDSWQTGDDLHWWDDFARDCLRCDTERIQVAAGTPIDAKGGKHADAG